MLVKGEPIERDADFLARSMESQSQGQFLVAIHLMRSRRLPFRARRGQACRRATHRLTRGMDARLELDCCSLGGGTSHSRRSCAISRWRGVGRVDAEVVSLGLRGCFTTLSVADQKVLGTSPSTTANRVTPARTTSS